tara:strand:- start:445 stop:666 length:222 start_codon:yes stop_codon:yes gene_type:complete
MSEPQEEDVLECTIEHGNGRQTKIGTVLATKDHPESVTVVQIFDGKIVAGIGFPLDNMEPIIHAMRQVTGFNR